MKRIAVFVLFALSQTSWGQAKFEVHEVTGKLLGFENGYGFVISNLKLQVGQSVGFYSFPPSQCQFLKQKFKVGDEMTIKAKINTTFKNSHVVDQPWARFFRDPIVEFWIDGNWLQIEKMPQNKPFNPRNYFSVFLEKKIEKIYTEGDYKTAFQFDGNKLAFSFVATRNYNEMKDLQEGQTVSFIGMSYQPEDGVCFPFPHIKQTCSYKTLLKSNGHITSFLFKQNFACIGMKLQTETGEIQLGFPSDMAEKMKSFSGKNQELTVYYDDYDVKGVMEPASVHAVIYQSDTLKIESLFYGGADVKHDHKAASIAGKITSVFKSKKGRLVGLVVSNQYFIESTSTMTDQLERILTKGNIVVIEGDQRIKKLGEIYSKNYEIIVPKRITIADKTYLVN